MDLTVNVRSVAAITSEVGVVFQQFNLFPHLSVLENRMPGPIYIEFVRAGVQSIVRGQVEAAHSIRLNCMQTMHYAILPQAVRHIFPPLTNQFIYIVKMSSFASAIGMQE
ncbi:Binding-protein-dependent transport system inner membrane component [Puniceibacterium sp. IMCC21224]|nr:Binding-protein-dependent transport system inner membrane component [Puniceibacterium sp. IMCC21224]